MLDQTPLKTYSLLKRNGNHNHRKSYDPKGHVGAVEHLTSSLNISGFKAGEVLFHV